MKNQAYHWEIKDIITQFVAAFNDTIITRYDKTRTKVDQIDVQYMYAPKDRVLHDLVNKSQHIKLPAVSISITGISRDSDRVFNKIFGEYTPDGSGTTQSAVTNHIPSPVPVNIEVAMSVITRYQTDMDQILSNFIPYSNPYIIISWPVPSDISGELKEIRSEVLWDGNISLEYPTELQATDRYRVSADTTFTIKGWLFPHKKQGDGPNIFYIETNFTPVTGFEYL